MLGMAQWPSQVVQYVKNQPANARDSRDVSSIPGTGRSPGGGNRNPFQYSCLETPMDRGAWQAVAQRVSKSQTTEHACMLGKFSAIISSNIFSGPFSLYSPSGTPIMWIFMHLMSQMSLRLSSVLFILVSIFYSVTVIFTILSPGSLSMLLHQLFCCGFLLVYYSSLFVCSLVFVGLW